MIVLDILAAVCMVVLVALWVTVLWVALLCDKRVT